MSLVEAIKQTTRLINPDKPNNPNFPHLTVPPFGQRSEGFENPYQAIINEPRPKHLPEPLIIDSAVSFCNYPASPHTPITIEVEDLSYPAHLVVWWYGESDGSRGYPTIIDLARMKAEDRKPFLEAIASQIRNAVLFLKEQNPKINQQEIHRYVEIYGLAGHTSPEDRENTGLSRGAQSHPMGHINVAYHPYEEYKGLAKDKPTGPRQFLKQIGPMDTVVFDKWKSYISPIIRKIFSKNDFQPNVISTETHKIGERCISLYEGFTIEFNNSQDLVNALETLCQVVGFFQGLYDMLRSGYDRYYQHIGDGRETLSSLKEKLIDGIKSYFNSQIPGGEIPHLDEFINEIIDFTLSFHPTYQQLVLWQESDDVSQQTKDQLARIQQKYEKIQEAINDSKRKPRLIKLLQKFYGFTSFEAEAYLQFFIDMTSPTAEGQWKNIEFTWAEQLSLSYLLDEYTIDENDNIQVTQLTISPRFFTNKGAFEDLAGMVINRPQAF